VGQTPILRDIPEQFETERLLIRAPRPGDGAELNRAVSESLDILRPWMAWAQVEPSIEDSEARVRHMAAAFLERTDLLLTLWLKGSDTLVGSSGIHRLNWDVPKGEIGYWCRASYEGKGYITEAAQGITRFAFDVLGMARMEIRCDSRNERSRRVAERVGYVLEGELRHDGVATDGTLRNTLVYSMLPEEFRAMPWVAGPRG
jgi:RimJ/RimL family protein N-acetyltransferase